MKSLSLNGRWMLTFGRQDDDAPASPQALAQAHWPTMEARVPGNVELDLVSAGVLREPSIGNHVYDLLDCEAYRWWYRRTFRTPSLEPGQRVLLRFDGLDCLGTIYVNGQSIGSTDNMFIEHQFDITSQLASGVENDLTVRIDSAVLAGRRHQPGPEEWANAANWEALDIRKAPHMYGWDIMPRIVSAGLWRGVSLVILDPTHWRHVYWATRTVDSNRRTATVLADWEFASDHREFSDLHVQLTLSRHGQVIHESEHSVTHTHGQAHLTLDDIDLWWPRGYGVPALYHASAKLMDQDGRILAEHVSHIGIRTIDLCRTDMTTPEQPGEFVFVVNGERIFVKGTNWVPLDAFHSRDAEHLPEVFNMLVDLNCNMVRCWGGNVYEDHAFFDLCDRNGIMVWQDFALACCLYPQTDTFADKIRREAEAVVAKLRNHPSLAIWAGNNEIDEAYQWSGYGLDPNDDRLSRQVLPKVVQKLDPFRPYLPSSPYRSPALVAAGNRDHLKPEDHLWGPRDDFKGHYYTTSPAHFVSEIGYHGCPDRASLAQMMEPGRLWPWQDNDQWLTHAVRPLPNFAAYNYRIELMARQIAVLFDQVPSQIDDYILASQISQAEALKFFIERFRMGKFRRTGILWWNLRDGWPIISDAVVDYYNRRKLAYHYIRRVQSDICVMVSEPNVERHEIIAVNDTLCPVTGTARVMDIPTGALLFEGPMRLPRNDKVVLGQCPAVSRPSMWRITWDGMDTIGLNHYLAGPRPFALEQYKGWLPEIGIDLVTKSDNE